MNELAYRISCNLITCEKNPSFVLKFRNVEYFEMKQYRCATCGLVMDSEVIYGDKKKCLS